MSILTVGVGETYTTIAAAVAAAQSDDTIDVDAGTYTNDFLGIYKNLTLNAVGGMVTMVATAAPPNGKAILDEGGSGVVVTIDGFAFTGAAVSSGNGAGIRYEGGTLNITNSHFYGNQDGLLANSDPAGAISISSSEFDHNGAGDGYTHNIYVNDIQSFTLTNSYIHDASVGHEIKSRAQNNTITNNRILDNNSTSSYEIDLPNGGDALISGNTIEQGLNSNNPNIIAYGEEGNLNSGTDLEVTGNTILNDLGSGPALWNATSAAATFSNNSVYGFGYSALVNGPANQSGTTVLATEPTLDQSAPYSVAVTPTPIPTSTQMATQTATPAAIPTPTLTGLVVDVSEDAWEGDAQFTISLDGTEVGGIQTVTASDAAGQFQAITVATVLSNGPHPVDISFINDAYGGTASTDRNLYVIGATYNGQAVADSTSTLDENGTSTFTVTAGPAVTSTAIINVSEDAYLGDAEFTVAIDGQQYGGTYTATALHGSGQSQAITITGIPEAFTSHDIAVTFLNDAYDGSPSTDRNLYVDSIQFAQEAVAGAPASLFSAGTVHFTAVAPAGWTS